MFLNFYVMDQKKSLFMIPWDINRNIDLTFFLYSKV